MIKSPFFGLAKPKLKYPVVENHEQGLIKEIPLPRKAVFFLKHSGVRSDDLILKVGDKVRTGQKLRLAEESKAYLISTVTGIITGISEHTGYLGQTYPAISIDAAGEDQWDDEFKESDKTPNHENALEFLNCLPGHPDLSCLMNYQTPVNTIIINGIDKELLITTNQIIVKTQIESLIEGLKHLKKIAHTSRIIIVVPPSLSSQAEKTGAEVKAINPVYPNALPEIIMKNILGKSVPAGKTFDEMGVGFINAEAVAALTTAFTREEIPVNKILTVINKDHSCVNVRARIGTPVRDILDTLGIKTAHGDRLIMGGPMTGNAIYSEDIPVMPDTDAIMVQDKARIIPNSDTHCVNCGECIRACPVNVPVNMLVRLLENSLYEEAAEEYDLLSCIECGLCSYVCIAQIPLFHYIMLGKHEYTRIKSAEASNA